MKIALLLVALLSGCASLPGVTITDAERKACEKQADCTVWSPQDLRELGRHFFGEGFKAGRDAVRKSL